MNNQFGGSRQGGPSNFPNSLEQHLAAVQQQNQRILQQQAQMNNQMQNRQIGNQPWTPQGHMTGHYGYGAPGPVWQPAPYYPPVPPPLQWDLGMDTPCHLNRTGCRLLQDIKVLKIKIEDRIDAITSSNPEILVRKFAEIVNC